VVLGMRDDKFPATQGASRAVIGITVLLVIATATTAIITSGGSTATSSAAATSSTTSTAASPAPAETSPGGTPAPATTTSTRASANPTATTGTPAPPSSPAAKPTAPSQPSPPLALAANPEGQLSYNTKQLSAKAGKVTIDMANMSPVPHNVVVAQGSKVLGGTPIKTGSSVLTLNLKPGTYTFYCAAPGHRQAGMEGTLTVS
jgi:plastocyanin